MTENPHSSPTAQEDLVSDLKLADALRVNDIPPCPRILQSIASEMRKEAPDMKMLAAQIGSDVALSASLLLLANSALYRRRQPVHSVQDAINWLGLSTIASAIAALQLKRLLPPGLQMERFWDTSAHVARLSAWLAERLGRSVGCKPDEAFTFGLFRDCGIPILLVRYPYYAATLTRANETRDRPFTDVEEDEFPTNHAVAGSLLSEGWWLPEKISLAIRHHHARAALTARSPLRNGEPELIAIAQLAEYLWQQISGLSKNFEWEKLGELCLARLKLDEAALPELIEEARRLLGSEPTIL
ncbi:MAG: HDOD domain-containing protein [Halothiobacillaceae bacterium]|nr:HDOD domain-containing protein [Halothiobacillaceae bacterium]